MTRLAVFHLGRAGEVAGGMTQVVNDYLAWDFPNSVQRLIETRGAGRLSDLAKWFAAVRHLRLLDPAESVVVPHLSQGGSFVREGLLGVLAYRRGLAVVCQVHGSSFPSFAARHRRLVRHVLANCDLVQVLSQESWNAVSRLDVSTEVVLIPNVVADVVRAPKENIAVFGGAVTKRKGVDTLLAAWAATTNRTGWRLVIAGPHLEPDLALAVPQGVEMPGGIPRAELNLLLARSAIAVLPSTDEGMPLFILEAMAAGAAVLATPVGGIPSVIDGTNGILVPPHDVRALSAALQSLIDDPAHRAALGGAARRTHTERYSVSAGIPQLEAAWAKAKSTSAQR